MPSFAKISASMQDMADDRAWANFAEHERQELQVMTDIFNKIDVKKSGAITQDEFRRYVQKHPKGWPLVDLFRAKTMNQNERDLLVNFWFRKLDTDRNGAVGYTEFLNMFIALKNTKTQESLYTDFLINLFDDNLDGLIDKDEFTKMMHVLFGEEPPQAVLDSMPTEGLDRDALTRVMHSVSMEYMLLPASSTFASQQSGMGFATGSAVIDSRVWNADSGLFETNAAAATGSGSNVITPNSPNTITAFGKATAATTNSSDSAKAKENAKQRNKARKEASDSASLIVAIAATAAVTAGLCVFAGIYARRMGKF